MTGAGLGCTVPAGGGRGRRAGGSERANAIAYGTAAAPALAAQAHREQNVVQKAEQALDAYVGQHEGHDDEQEEHDGAPHGAQVPAGARGERERERARE